MSKCLRVYRTELQLFRYIFLRLIELDYSGNNVTLLAESPVFVNTVFRFVVYMYKSCHLIE